MADALGPRLHRLQELSKKLNSTADDITKVVQNVETYLTEICRLGVPGATLIEERYDDKQEILYETHLAYGRYGGGFRLLVTSRVRDGGSVLEETVTPWANTPRDLKLVSYLKLPALLDTLIENAQETLAAVETNTEALLSLLPPARGKKEVVS